MPESEKNAILEALAEIPYKVIWKYEGMLANVPENVRIYKWVPQQDVLRKFKFFL